MTVVNYTPGSNFNMCSVTRLLMQGWLNYFGGQHWRKNHFWHCRKDSKRSYLCNSIHLWCRGNCSKYRFWHKDMNINQADSLLGHGNNTSTRLSAKELGWEITWGTMKPCKHCACSKAKQKFVSKEATTEKSKKPCKRVYLDLSKITVPHDDGTESKTNKKNWRIMVDEATGKKWSSFHDSKSGMVEPTCKLLNVLKSKGLPVRKICLDPVGENVNMEKWAKSVDWAILQPIDFEFTSRDTPQYNFGWAGISKPGWKSACNDNRSALSWWFEGKDCIRLR